MSGRTLRHYHQIELLTPDRIRRATATATTAHCGGTPATGSCSCVTRG
ncbi:hypothetical protein QJS66_23355 (plasmid) [Kocuria rhizophila]|nr:hypothetical protein QJS66_23355 [Kocuria rhizophila]